MFARFFRGGSTLRQIFCAILFDDAPNSPREQNQTDEQAGMVAGPFFHWLQQQTVQDVVRNDVKNTLQKMPEDTQECFAHESLYLDYPATILFLPGHLKRSRTFNFVRRNDPEQRI